MSAPPTTEPEIDAMEHRPNTSALTTVRVLNRGEATTGVPVTTGICLPRSTVSDPTRLTIVSSSGQSVLTQVDVNERWSDGSAKWVLVNFVASELPPGESVWSVTLLERELSVAVLPLEITDNDEAGFEITIAEQKREITFPAERGDGDFVFKPLNSQSEEGVVRSEFCFRRVCVTTGLRLECRVSRWRDCDRVRLDVKLHNPNAAKHPNGLWDLGGPGSILFDRFSVHVGCDADEIGWLAEHGDDLEWIDVSKRLARGLPFSILQASSGKENWDSRNHVNASGKNLCGFRGYKAETPRGQVSGNHANPVAVARCGADKLSMFVPEFWQQFPNALHGGCNGLRTGLFPEINGKHELQGGEQKTQSIWLSVGDEPRVDVVASMSVEWITRCQVLPWFDEKTTAAHAHVDRFLEEALGRGNSWEQRRDVIDEYGWRNFGDVHADHEQRHFDGDGAVISHYNNQFDLILGGIQHHTRTGDATWFDFFDQLARHVSDIDVYHTDKDRDAYNGGLFWHTDHYADAATSTHRTYSKRNAKGTEGYGGGQSDEHNYTTGLLFHHYLTGNPQSRDAVVKLADWVIGMDDGTQTIFSLVDDEPSGWASTTKDLSYHGPGRGSGNSVNALVDAWSLTKDRRYLAKADELIRRVVHPKQNLSDLNLPGLGKPVVLRRVADGVGSISLCES